MGFNVGIAEDILASMLNSILGLASCVLPCLWPFSEAGHQRKVSTDAYSFHLMNYSDMSVQVCNGAVYLFTGGSP
jgi:hypothetical protein